MTATLLPGAAYALLVNVPALDPKVLSGGQHFIIVGTVSLVALLLAGAVAWAAYHTPDARTVTLALALISMSGIFLAHGAGTSRWFPLAPAVSTTAHAGHAPAYSDFGGAYGTPAATRATPPPAGKVQAARRQAVGLSARLSLMVSALWLAHAAAGMPRRVADWVVRQRLALASVMLAITAGYAVVALWFPVWLSWAPVHSHELSWAIAVIAWSGFGFAGWRFAQAYRLASLPLQGTMALAMAYLMQAQWFMLRGELWRLSWWEYHVTMLAGFLLPALGLLWQYRINGDLGAVVEGLFLRDTVSGLRQGDPRALGALAAAVAAKDSETDEHTTRVGDLAVAIARRVRLPEERIELLRWAGRLHDAGKIGVPNRILRKPGPLTPAEFAVIQRHAARGGRIAHRSRLLARAAPIIRAHHERMDGSGYPDGLRGDAIPLEARIIAVADVWDALTCDRPYRAAMPPSRALAVIHAERGTKLDSACVDGLLDVLATEPHTTAA